MLKLQTKLHGPGLRRAYARSEDWSQWFAAQAKTGWQQGQASLSSRWGKSISPSKVLPEYPRPQMSRPRWMNLNGLWSFNVVACDDEKASDFPGQILVPFVRA